MDTAFLSLEYVAWKILERLLKILVGLSDLIKKFLQATIMFLDLLMEC